MAENKILWYFTKAKYTEDKSDRTDTTDKYNYLLCNIQVIFMSFAVLPLSLIEHTNTPLEVQFFNHTQSNNVQTSAEFVNQSNS